MTGLTDKEIIDLTIQAMDEYNQMLGRDIPEYYANIIENNMNSFFKEIDKRGLENELEEATYG